MVKFVSALVALLFAAIVSGQPVHADDWPSKPIRIYVGFGAGGGTDIVTRIVAQPLSELLGQPVIVENKPGAGGTLASAFVAKADKDGHTATMLSPGHTVSAAMFKTLPYNSLDDFAPVALVANSTVVFVARKEFPANNISELVALAKKNPGNLKFGSVGLGSTQHFAGELLHQLAGIDVLRVPYRGTPALVTALLANEVDYGVELLHAVKGQVDAGQLKFLAVGSRERSPAVPNIPTVAEQGIAGYSVVSWYGLAYPAGTPKAIVDRTNAALKDIVARPAIREQLAKVGVSANYSTPEQFQKFLKSEIETWQAVREKAGIAQN